MLPIGTRTTVICVDHLGAYRKPKRLIGRTGVVVGHRDGMNLVAELTRLERVTGVWLFDDSDVIPGQPVATAPKLPRVRRVRGYWSPMVTK